MIGWQLQRCPCDHHLWLQKRQFKIANNICSFFSGCANFELFCCLCKHSSPICPLLTDKTTIWGFSAKSVSLLFFFFFFATPASFPGYLSGHHSISSLSKYLKEKMLTHSSVFFLAKLELRRQLKEFPICGAQDGLRLSTNRTFTEFSFWKC